MTSASELFYTRRSRVGRPDPDPGIGSSVDRNYNRRNHVHNHRHDLDGCDPLRRSPHVRHSSSRAPSLSERASMRFDQGTSQFVSTNGLNADGVSSSSRPSLNSNERLPGAVLLARARLLERLRGVSVSSNRRNSRAPPSGSGYRREYLFGDEFRLVDAGDWGSDISTGLSAGTSPFTEQTSQTERLEILRETNKKPPGLTQEALDSLPLEVFSSGEVDVERKLSRESWDCSICLEIFKDEDLLTRLPCGHRFHLACLDPWVRTCGDCPYCRTCIL